MQVTRFGHSCLLVEADGARVMIDPGNYSSDSAFEQHDLDAVFVTHQHPDHLDRDRAPLLFVRNMGVKRFCDPDTADQLDDSWQPFADGGHQEFGNLAVTAAGGLHERILSDLPQVTNTGLLLRANGVTLFHPGDSYEHAPVGVDILALPLQAPWAKASSTVDFVRRVAPKVLFAIHDGGVTSMMRSTYLGHVRNFGGVADVRDLGPSESVVFA